MIYLIIFFRIKINNLISDISDVPSAHSVQYDIQYKFLITWNYMGIFYIWIPVFFHVNLFNAKK